MSKEELQWLLAEYHDLIRKICLVDPCEASEHLYDKRVGTPLALMFPSTAEHVAWMCLEASKFVLEGRVEKAMRWLGFIQAWLWAVGLKTVNDLKNDGKPEEAS